LLSYPAPIQRFRLFCGTSFGGSGPGGRRFKSFRPDHSKMVQPGNMGNTLYRLHG